MLEASGTTVRTERNSRKEPLTDKEVKAMLGKVGSVVVCKGKQSTVIKASQAKPADLKGPTGNYRAPMLLKGKKLLVGFNREALLDLL